MNQIKKLLYLIPPFITSYLFNCYVFSTLDFTKFPEESKIASYAISFIAFCVLYIIEDDILKENKVLKEKLNKL